MCSVLTVPSLLQRFVVVVAKGAFLFGQARPKSVTFYRQKMAEQISRKLIINFGTLGNCFLTIRRFCGIWTFVW